MAFDAFLKIDGIPGESPDAKHKDEIQLESFSWGATQTGTMAFGGGGGSGKVAMQDFHFVMKANKASPKLLLTCATGEHIKKAVLTCRKAGKDQQDYYKVTLTDVLVSSYQAGGGGDLPTDQISLNFAKVEFEYAPQNEKGALGTAVKVGYDLKLSKMV